MSKDPATLWYWNDWYSGTVLLNRFLKGCYMDLLHAQFNHGRLSLEEIKTCLGQDFETAWPSLEKKFIKDDTGLYYNERAEVEKLKRQSYCQSRRNNRKNETYDTTYEKHMLQHMENENENININVIKEDRGVGKETIYPIEHCLTVAMADTRWVESNATNETELTEFNKYLEKQGTYEFNPLDYKRYFSHWKPKKKQPEKLKPWKIKRA